MAEMVSGARLVVLDPWHYLSDAVTRASKKLLRSRK